MYQGGGHEFSNSKTTSIMGFAEILAIRLLEVEQQNTGTQLCDTLCPELLLMVS
jgi:hypothetical protein